MKILKSFQFVVVLLIFTLFSIQSSAQYYYDFNDRCEAAYNAMISLRLNEGKAIIDQELRANPNNLIPV